MGAGGRTGGASAAAAGPSSRSVPPSHVEQQRLEKAKSTEGVKAPVVASSEDHAQNKEVQWADEGPAVGAIKTDTPQRHRKRGKEALEPEAAYGETYYRNIMVGQPSHCQMFNDICLWFKHLVRTVNRMDILKSCLESKSESDALKAAEETNGGVITNFVIVNMLVWRRSIMKVITFFMLVWIWLYGCDLWMYWRPVFTPAAPFVSTGYADWARTASEAGLDSDFGSYTMAFLAEFYDFLTRSSGLVIALTNTVIMVCYVIAFCMIQLALKSWTDGRSRGLVQKAWVIWTLAPFLGSMVPSKLFVTSVNTEPLRNTYANDLHTQLANLEAVNQVNNSCAVMDDRGTVTVDTVGEYVLRVCGIALAVPSVFYVPSGIFTWNRVDLGWVHGNCTLASDAVEEERPQEALAYLSNICGETEDQADIIMQYSPQTAEYLMARITMVIEFAVSLGLAVANVQVLLPAAMSIAPGLVQGSLLMKLMLPQSCIPGIMVVSLPLVYAPLLWAIYSIIFQLVGDIFFFLALISISAPPFIYVLVGNFYRLDTPMTDQLALKAVTDIERAEMAMLYTFLICVLAYVGNIWYARSNYLSVVPGEDAWLLEGEIQLVRQFSDFQNWTTAGMIMLVAKLVAFFFSKLYLSSVAALDFMTNTVVESYNYESHFRTTIELQRNKQLKATGQKEILALQMHERMQGLMALSADSTMSVSDRMKQPQKLVKGVLSAAGGLFQPRGPSNAAIPSSNSARSTNSTRSFGGARSGTAPTKSRNHGPSKSNKRRDDGETRLAGKDSKERLVAGSSKEKLTVSNSFQGQDSASSRYHPDSSMNTSGVGVAESARR